MDGVFLFKKLPSERKKLNNSILFRYFLIGSISIIRTIPFWSSIFTVSMRDICAIFVFDNKSSSPYVYPFKACSIKSCSRNSWTIHNRINVEIIFEER